MPWAARAGNSARNAGAHSNYIWLVDICGPFKF